MKFFCCQKVLVSMKLNVFPFCCQSCVFIKSLFKSQGVFKSFDEVFMNFENRILKSDQNFSSFIHKGIHNEEDLRNWKRKCEKCSNTMISVFVKLNVV